MYVFGGWNGKIYFNDDNFKLKKISLYSSSQKSMLGTTYIENSLTILNKLEEPLYQGEFCLETSSGWRYWHTCFVIDYDNIISQEKKEKFKSMFSIKYDNYKTIEIKYLKIMDKNGHFSQTLDDFIAC